MWSEFVLWWPEKKVYVLFFSRETFIKHKSNSAKVEWIDTQIKQTKFDKFFYFDKREMSWELLPTHQYSIILLIDNVKNDGISLDWHVPWGNILTERFNEYSEHKNDITLAQPFEPLKKTN